VLDQTTEIISRYNSGFASLPRSAFTDLVGWLHAVKADGWRELAVSGFSIEGLDRYPYSGRLPVYGLSEYDRGFRPGDMLLDFRLHYAPEDKVLPYRMGWEPRHGAMPPVDEHVIDEAWRDFQELLMRASYERDGGNQIRAAVIYFMGDYNQRWWMAWNDDDNAWSTNLPISSIEPRIGKISDCGEPLSECKEEFIRRIEDNE
jgi:hypothetical protein